MKKTIKNLLKNNTASVVVLVILISIAAVFAGNVYITDGDVDVDDDLNVSDVLFVDSTNNKVGIGTTSPEDDFHLVGSHMLMDNALAIRFKNSTGAVYDGIFPYSDDDLYITTQKDIVFRSGGTSYTQNMRILKNGNVGIGTTSPQNKLDVEGGAVIGAAYSGTNTAPSNGLLVEGSMCIGCTSPSTALEINGNIELQSGGIIQAAGAGQITLGNANDYVVINPGASGASAGLGIESIDNEAARTAFYIQDEQSNTYMSVASTGAGDSDKGQIYISGNVGIGDSTPTEAKLVVVGDASGISIYASKNISATGYITRTSVFDKSKGFALDFVKDADDYVSNGEIQHSRFYGYAGEFEVTDYSRPETEEYSCINEETEEETICERTIYPYTTIEEGVLLDAEINVLRQAVYELSKELCSKDNTYSWCK